MSSASLIAPQTLNLYSYCGNDPINRTDPSGLFWGAVGRFFKQLFKWLMIAVVVALVVVSIVSSGGTVAGFLGALWGSVSAMFGVGMGFEGTLSTTMFAGSASFFSVGAVAQFSENKKPKPKKISAAGIRLIKFWEAKCYYPYEDKNNGLNCTVGFGTVIGSGRKCTSAERARKWTDQEINDLFQKRVTAHVESVNRILDVEVTDGQFAALVDLSFNAGLSRNSGIIRAVNGRDFGKARERLGEYNKARNKNGNLEFVKGLDNRRKADQEVWDTGVFNQTKPYNKNACPNDK